MKTVVSVVVILIVLAVAWFLASPLFIDRAVDEPFGGLNMDGVMAMPDDKRAAMRDEIMQTAAAMPDKTNAEPMPNIEPAVIAMGTFIDADAIHKGEGTASVYALPDGRQLLRFEDFRTTNGPALYVYLAKHPSPTSAADVTDEGFVSLGELKGNVGNQNYEIPTGVDVSDYGSVVIWCQLFGVLFSPAALEAA